jgi:peptidoglycan-N-acetylglucosamine deacetylase
MAIMHAMDEPNGEDVDASPTRGGVATAEHPPSASNPNGRGPGSRPRKARRLFTAASLTVVTLCLLALVSLITGVGAAWSQVGGLEWLRSAMAPGHAAQPTATAQQQPTATGQPGRPDRGLLLSPQGCVLDTVAPKPPSYLIYSASGTPAGARGEVALTFDDGPSPVYTRQILSILQRWGVHATFFVVGRHAQLYPDVVRAEWQAGDAIGNHTYTHAYLPGLTGGEIASQLSVTSADLRAITGDRCLWLFRPPYGAVNALVPAIARQQGLTTIQWDVEAQDWLRPGSQVIAQRIITGMYPGAIILLHDSAPDNENGDRSQTVAALPIILAAMRAQGLRPVTLPTLLHDAGLVHWLGETPSSQVSADPPPPWDVAPPPTDEATPSQSGPGGAPPNPGE